MSCFPCFSSSRRKKDGDKEITSPSGDHETKKQKAAADPNAQPGNINAKNFNFRELATATKNFRQECLLGEGGFGRVFKGTFQATGQVMAVKQLDRHGLQGNKEFLVEVRTLSLLEHQNLVKLIGYCADGDQRLLVYEYMAGGSLEDCLLDLKEGQKPLDWFTRIKIASGAARGLEYLHDTANPPVIYRVLKSSNILLDEGFHPKLSDFGLAKLGPEANNKLHGPSRVMGTYGYCAPEYERSGNLTVKSDVYSFGVVLLELITGRRAIDTRKPIDEQNLVSWAQPFFRDPKKFPDLADPLLQRQFPEKDLNQAVAIAAMCLQEEPSVRPLMSDVVATLSFLSTTPENAPPMPPPTPTPQEKVHNEKENSTAHRGNDSSSSQSSESEGEQIKRRSSRDASSKSKTDKSDSSSSAESSDYEEEEEGDEENGAYDHQASFMSSQEFHPFVPPKISRISRDESVSSSSKSFNTDYGSSYSSHRSSSRSESRRISSRKSSKKVPGQITGTSSRARSRKPRDRTVSLTQKKGQDPPAARAVSLGNKTNRKSPDGSISFLRNSRHGSKKGSSSSDGSDGKNVLKRITSGESETKPVHLGHAGYSGTSSDENE